MIKKFVPTYHTKSFLDLTVEGLKSKGIKVVLSDLDNTLDCYTQKVPTEPAINFVKNLHKAGIKVVIVSNNFERRVKPYADKLGVSLVSRAGKPGGKKLRKVLKEHKIDKNSVILIGDQLFTDIWAGNHAKIKTILVDKYTELDQPFTRIKRIFEKPIMKRMKKKGLIKEWVN